MGAGHPRLHGATGLIPHRDPGIRGELSAPGHDHHGGGHYELDPGTDEPAEMGKGKEKRARVPSLGESDAATGASVRHLAGGGLKAHRAVWHDRHIA
jgi:hypothetical protein